MPTTCGMTRPTSAFMSPGARGLLLLFESRIRITICEPQNSGPHREDEHRCSRRNLENCFSVFGDLADILKNCEFTRFSHNELLWLTSALFVPAESFRLHANAT